ncbi:histidinol-phosphate transaminase [Neisseriaceae bacterium TC5R-5]|nr:histidinol-phosphate transaminase [Neisseriaceae bacterium TC5R-5]
MTAIASLNALARAEVRSLGRYNAGLSSETVRQRFGLERVSKLGSNENPLGPSPDVITALNQSAGDCWLYPDAHCSLLRTALAEYLKVPEDRLVFGNGSEDLLGIICRVFLDHGDQVVTILPSFGLHIMYPQAAGAEVITVPLNKELNFDVTALLAAITPRTRLLMFSCPANPVGSTLTNAQLQHLVDELPEHVLLVFDEAYYEYAATVPGYPDCLAVLEASGKPFILLRTFSKAYALAGLRVGYGVVSHPQLADLIDRLRTPFNVNRQAQVAALAALKDQAHLHKSIQHVVAERSRMTQALQQLDIKLVPSFANFLFFSSPLNADKLNQTLLSRGVIIKPWKESGYEQFLRVSIGSQAENDHFLQELTAALKR